MDAVEYEKAFLNRLQRLNHEAHRDDIEACALADCQPIDLLELRSARAIMWRRAKQNHIEQARCDRERAREHNLAKSWVDTSMMHRLAALAPCWDVIEEGEDRRSDLMMSRRCVWWLQQGWSIGLRLDRDAGDWSLRRRCERYGYEWEIESLNYDYQSHAQGG